MGCSGPRGQVHTRHLNDITSLKSTSLCFLYFYYDTENIQTIKEHVLNKKHETTQKTFYILEAFALLTDWKHHEYGFRTALKKFPEGLRTSHTVLAGFRSDDCGDQVITVLLGHLAFSQPVCGYVGKLTMTTRRCAKHAG